MHIVIANRWPRYSDGRRWDNELTRYEDYVDHRRNRVSYVVDPAGARGVLVDRSLIASYSEISDINDFAALRGAVASAQQQVGPVDELIALSEFTLEIAARVRAELSIPGPRPEDVAVYRNKMRMKELVEKAGIRVPRYIGCSDTAKVITFAADRGYPLIIKPVDGAGSVGVHKVDGPAQLIGHLDGLDGTRHEVEEFINGELHHVDGYVDADCEVEFQVVSRYINDCLSFERGQPLGSVILNRGPLQQRIKEFTRVCLQALEMRDKPFHLELFVTPDDDLVFVEVGGRVGGSEVPHLLNRVFGVNLYEVWLRAMAGERVPIAPTDDDRSGGWLIVPKPAQLPARVRRAPSMLQEIPGLWRELVPDVGEVLEPGGSYDSLHSGRFIFLGDRQDQVLADVRRVLDVFRLETEHV